MRAALEKLAASAAALCAVAFALNAVLSPYSGITYDAVLYGGQVLNRTDPGCLGGDLFFRHGSQDRYSAFSPLVAPAVQLLGFPLAFGLGYLASLLVYLVGALRLARALFPEPWLAAVGFLAMALVEAPFGRASVFAVPEAFFTPRLAACGFALWSLERALAGRIAGTLAFGVLGMALHPLMAVGPLAVAAGELLRQRLGLRAVLLLAALMLAALAIVLFVEPLGLRIFGTMDDDWKAAVRRMTYYNFVAEWSALDHVRTACAGGTLLLAAWVGRARPAFAGFCALLFLVGAAGWLSSALAAGLPYALLLQGQGYRAVWVWSVLQLPLAFGIASMWWNRGPAWRFAAALLVVGTFALLATLPPEFRMMALGFVGAAVVLRGKNLWRAVLVAGAFGFAFADLLLLAAILRGDPDFQEVRLLTPVWPQLFVRQFSPLLRLAIAMTAVAIAAKLSARRAILAFGAVGLAAVALGGFGAESRGMRSTVADRDCVAAYVASHPNAAGARPTLFYCGRVGLWDVWQHCRAQCYQHPAQASGSVFHRATALEADRRTSMVKRYWIATTPWAKHLYPPEDAVPPDEALLRSLAADPAVDVIAVPFEVPGLWAASNGRIFVYDARTLRSSPRD